MRKGTIDAWSVAHAGNEFMAPEIRVVKVQGVLREDGRPILTSRIVRVDGRVVTTASGSVYTLGDPAPEYVAWLAERGDAIDPERPIRVRAA